jgi:hypothetical protein
MEQSKQFATGIAVALQTIHDFENVHGHLHLDALTANSFSEGFSKSLQYYAIVFNDNKFQVIRRALPEHENQNPNSL